MKILLLAFLISSAVAAEVRVIRYPYDECEGVSSKLAFGASGELRRAGARVVSNYASGDYLGEVDFSSGDTLHLFPDNRAMISSSCDICPTKLVAEGEWKIEGEVIQIRWKKWYVDERLKKVFVDDHGQCESLRLYLVFDPAKTVRQVLLVSKDKDGPNIERPLIQHSRYTDWKRMADDLQTTKG